MIQARIARAALGIDRHTIDLFRELWEYYDYNQR